MDSHDDEAMVFDKEAIEVTEEERDIDVPSPLTRKCIFSNEWEWCTNPTIQIDGPLDLCQLCHSIVRITFDREDGQPTLNQVQEMRHICL